MNQFRRWAEALPKIELHLHLEGAIPLACLLELIDKYGGEPGIGDVAALRQRLTYNSFADFIDTWVWKNGFLREAEDFSYIAEAMARDLERQNIRYAEVFFSPSRFADTGLSPQALLTAVRAGLNRVAGVTVALIPDLVRDLGPESALRTLSAILEVRDQGVIGVGMGGSEHRFPAEPFAPVFARARDAGLYTGAHAGEAAGASSVRATLDALRVDRIGHGIRAVEDDALVDRLAASRLPLEVCPLSNVATGVVDDIGTHPVRQLWERGVFITVNTDDPGMFHNSLAEEYDALHRHHGFSADEVRQLIVNAVDASWQDSTARAALHAALRADPGWA